MAINFEALREVMRDERVSTRGLATAMQWDSTTVHRLVHGRIPKRKTDAQVEAELRAGLEKACFTKSVVEAVFEVKVGTDMGGAPCNELKRVPDEEGRIQSEPAPSETLAEVLDSQGEHSDKESDIMLIQRQTVTPQARSTWRVFGGALQTPHQRDQVFLGCEARVVYEHMLAKAKFGGLLAVVGESGAGKTTIKDLLVSDLVEQGDVIVIEPHTQAMEGDDKTGKTLKVSHLNEAILREIASGQKLRRTMEAQLNQVAACLGESLESTSTRRHLLVIDEAHALPKPTLRHLKRFLEIKNPAKKGLQRPMLAILLLGQPELADRLSPFDQSVREVWQRCEVAHLRPLAGELDAYIRHRLGDAAGAFAPDALPRLATLLTGKDGVSRLYPLAVDNWVALLLNRCAGLAPSITAEMVDEVVSDVRRGRR